MVPIVTLLAAFATLAAGEVQASQGVHQGNSAPSIAAPSLSGKPFDLLKPGHYAATSVFFFCGCDECHVCARRWAQFEMTGILESGDFSVAKPARTVVVFSGEPSACRAFLRETGLNPAKTIVVPDPEMKFTDVYGADPCPRAFVIDAAGKVVYTNEHADDAPQTGKEAAIVDRTLAALRKCPAGK